MKKEIKEKWVDALRSGKFEQGIGSLYNDGKYCCLGVLCRIYLREKKKGWGVIQEEIDSDGEVLPSVVREWAELRECNPLTKIGNTRHTLGHVNDEGYNFQEIAEIIKKQL